MINKYLAIGFALLCMNFSNKDSVVAGEVFTDEKLGFKVELPNEWVDQTEGEPLYSKGTSTIGINFDSTLVSDIETLEERVSAAFAAQVLTKGFLPLVKPEELKLDKISAMRFKIRSNLKSVKDQSLVEQVSFIHKRKLVSFTLISKDSRYEKDKTDFDNMINSLSLSKGTEPAPADPDFKDRSEGYGQPCQEDQDCPKNLSCIYDICQEQ